MVSPPANSSEVSIQSSRPAFRAMKPSRLATMWMVTREWNGLATRDIDLRPQVDRVARGHQSRCALARETLHGHKANAFDTLLRPTDAKTQTLLGRNGIRRGINRKLMAPMAKVQIGRASCRERV